MIKKEEKSESRDIVIPVMGATGSGKSSFINTLVGQDVMRVGHNMTPCTSEIKSTSYNLDNWVHHQDPSVHLNGHRLVLVDMPGFDDTFIDDAETLRHIAEWLETSYRDKLILGGVIFLHDVSMNRFTGTARRNLRVFQCLCGDAALGKVVLGSTMWSKVVGSSGDRNEKELREIHWEPLISKGSMVYRFIGHRDSAWELVDALLGPVAKRLAQHSEEKYLRIQLELGEERKIIPETAAGRELFNALQQAIAMQEKLVRLQSCGMDDSTLKKELLETQKKIQRLREQLKELKLPFTKKWLAFIGL